MTKDEYEKALAALEQENQDLTEMLGECQRKLIECFDGFEEMGKRLKGLRIIAAHGPHPDPHVIMILNNWLGVQ